MNCSCWKKFLILSVFIVSYGVFIYKYQEKSAVFDPKLLSKIAKDASKLNVTSAKRIEYIEKKLLLKYPKYIDTSNDWVFNMAGGAMGQMKIYHVSLTEYLIIFGTPIGTEGFSGRYLADDYFIIIEGEQHVYYPGELSSRVYRPGDLNLMPLGKATGYKMPSKTYALEYARGNILYMLPFGISEIFTNFDFVSYGTTIFHAGRSVFRQLSVGKI